MPWHYMITETTPLKPDSTDCARGVVTGGLVFFEEYKGTTTGELLIIYAGIALMISAMVSIAFCELQRRTFIMLLGSLVLLLCFGQRYECYH